MKDAYPGKNAELLFKTLREMVPERDLDALLQRVIKVSTKILGAERALLFLYDKTNESLVFKYGVNIEEDLIEEAHQFSSSVIERAMAGEVIMTSDLQGDTSLSSAESVRSYNIKTILCAPIISEEKLIGVIYADTRDTKSFLDEERKAYFLSFVDFIANVIEGALDLHDAREELSYLKRRLVERTVFPEIVGRSPAIEGVKEKIMRIASVDYPVSVLIMGESGTGKELIAGAIYQAGSRSGKPFVTVNSAAIPATLMESELFGHEKGSFTGATARKRGFFEKANGGVLFLDEIGDLPPELQPKLLRALQFGTFSRVGGETELSVDVQVLCATSKDLHREMEEGRFIKPLFHRLAVEVVRVPPLRERRQDVLLLANHFMTFFSEKMKKPIAGIDVRAQNLLKRHDYAENNVRELKNVMERAVLSAGGRQITEKEVVFSEELLFGNEETASAPEVDDLPDTELIRINEKRIARELDESGEADEPDKSGKIYYRVQSEVEKKLILLSLRRNDWKMKRAARQLGISHINLRSKLETIVRDYLLECENDIERVSRNHGIPLKFLHLIMQRIDTG